MSAQAWSAIRLALAVVVLGTIAVSGCKLIAGYNVSRDLLSAGFGVAALIACVYRLINPLGWTLVLQGLGYQPNVIQSMRIWLIAESRRWLPGGVWGYASRAVGARELGVPLAVASGSMMLELLITMAAAALVGLAGLAGHYERFSVVFLDCWRQKLDHIDPFFIGLIAVTGSILIPILLRKKFRAKLLGLRQRFQPLRGVRFRWPKLAAALVYMTCMAALNGYINVILLTSADSRPSVPLLVMIAATATAWIVGLLAFFAPGGIVVREATLAALLLPWLSYDTGITLAVLSRAAQMFAEVACILLTIVFVPARTTNRCGDRRLATSSLPLGYP
jgi:hypothetical protein